METAERTKPKDTLCAILVLTSNKIKRGNGTNEVIFNANHHDLQRIFHEISGGFEILKPFAHSDVPPIAHWSSTLEEAFGELRIAGLINRYDIQNPSLFVITKSGEKYAKELRLTLGEFEEINEIAEQLVFRIPTTVKRGDV